MGENITRPTLREMLEAVLDELVLYIRRVDATETAA